MKSNLTLLQKPKISSEIYQKVTPKTAKWEYLSFEARQMKSGSVWNHNTNENEMVIVLLSGNYKIISNRGEWETSNGRVNVFSVLLTHFTYRPIQNLN